MVRKIRLGVCASCGGPILVDIAEGIAPVGDACRHCGADLDEESVVK